MRKYRIHPCPLDQVVTIETKCMMNKADISYLVVTPFRWEWAFIAIAIIFFVHVKNGQQVEMAKDRLLASANVAAATITVITTVTIGHG